MADLRGRCSRSRGRCSARTARSACARRSSRSPSRAPRSTSRSRGPGGNHGWLEILGAGHGRSQRADGVRDRPGPLHRASPSASASNGSRCCATACATSATSSTPTPGSWRPSEPTGTAGRDPRPSARCTDDHPLPSTLPVEDHREAPAVLAARPRRPRPPRRRTRRGDEPQRARGRGRLTPGAGTAGVRTARVLSWEPHPDADRLRVAHVTGDGGEGEIELVCGASNFDVGDVVAHAAPGATIPGRTGRSGWKRKIRGVVSNGMLASARELQLGDDHDGILVLPQDTPLGVDLGDLLPLGEPVIEIAVQPDRGDHQSVLGVARDLAAILDTTWHAPEVPDALDGPVDPGHDRDRRVRTVRDVDARGRHRAAVAAVAAAAAGAVRGPVDRRGRRRHQLRHARARSAPARVRPRHPAGPVRCGSVGPTAASGSPPSTTRSACPGGRRPGDRRCRACRSASPG
jgi:tRNA-binding EMAP/Myf-like protein